MGTKEREGRVSSPFTFMLDSEASEKDCATSQGFFHVAIVRSSSRASRVPPLPPAEPALRARPSLFPPAPNSPSPLRPSSSPRSTSPSPLPPFQNNSWVPPLPPAPPCSRPPPPPPGVGHARPGRAVPEHSERRERAGSAGQAGDGARWGGRWRLRLWAGNWEHASAGGRANCALGEGFEWGVAWKAANAIGSRRLRGCPSVVWRVRGMGVRLRWVVGRPHRRRGGWGGYRGRSW